MHMTDEQFMAFRKQFENCKMKLRKMNVQGAQTMEGKELRRLTVQVGAHEVGVDILIGCSAPAVAKALRSLADEIHRAVGREAEMSASSATDRDERS